MTRKKNIENYFVVIQETDQDSGRLSNSIYLLIQSFLFFFGNI